jgi:hypothetical protein
MMRSPGTVWSCGIGALPGPTAAGGLATGSAHVPPVLLPGLAMGPGDVALPGCIMTTDAPPTTSDMYQLLDELVTAFAY